MNDKFTNNTNSDENIARKLNQVADQTTINAQFASELEERLRIAHRPKMSWFASSFKQVSPTLRWVGLVILLGLVLNWSIKSLIPAPQPSTDITPVPSDIATPTPNVLPNDTQTPVTEDGGFDWRGTKLYLSVPLSQLPTNARVYSLKDEQPATVDIARVLATQFGIQGNVYETPRRLAGIPGYLVTDGKQRLYIHSALNYDYYSEYSIFSFLSGGKNISNEQASAAIDAFMKAHGMDFEYQIEKAHQIPGAFYVVPLTPDGLPVRYDYNMPSRFEFTVNDDGQVVLMSSYRVDYDLVGTYDIRTAEEAFQQVLGSSNVMQDGVLEITYSGASLNEYFWQRAYPDNQTVTIYGQPIVYPAAETDALPFVSIGQYTATGNVNGIENIDPSNYVEAIGQFTTENSIRIFDVETWRILESQETSISGILRREGDQVVLMPYNGISDEYIIEAARTDVPLNTSPDEQLNVNGFLMNGTLNWTSIQYFPANSGGGGGGTGFYKLNLSGTPVPFPPPTLQPDTNQGTVEYVIKEGDTLLGIAEAYGLTPEKIVHANSWLLDEPVLMPGNRLIIPVEQINSQTTEYVVQENDTLAYIALNFGITVDELMQANGITDNSVFTGQKLIIPRGQVTSGQGITLPEEQLTQLEIGQQLEGMRGIFQVNIYEKSQRIWYGFFNINGEDSIYYILEGTDLQNLEAHNNLPVDIWGTVDRFDQYGKPIVKVERYEIPFPDLKFQIFEGTQKLAEIQGQPVILFTTNNGETYIELTASGTRFEQSGIFGKEGDEILTEALAIPDESFGDYPGLRIFSMNYAIDSISGQANKLTITADQFNTYEEPPTSTGAYIPPTATIEKVELVYYTPDPRSTPPDPNAGPQYIQPAWRFYGHYSNGDEFEILVQALKQEYLLPELAPYTPPG